MQFTSIKRVHVYMQELVSNRRITGWFSLLLALIIFTTCVDEPELPQKTYPYIFPGEVTEINDDGATLHADLIEGTEKIIERGFIWGERSDLDFTDQHIALSSDASEFTFRITKDLRDENTYYVMAYAKTHQLTIFSSKVSFKSLGTRGDIEINTLPVSYATSFSAKTGGNILKDGNSFILNKGIIWSTKEYPTLTDYEGLTSEGEGMGYFLSIATDLTDNTQYFVRSYAYNRKDTAYGMVISFTTLKNLVVNGDGVTDIDGNHYPSVIIGDQEWMAKNLMTRKYRNGDPIQTNIGGETEAYTIYPFSRIDNLNSPSKVLEAYGALYNFYAVSDKRGLCPSGWHIPDVAEFEELINYLTNTLQINNDPRELNGVGSHLKSTRQVNSPLGGSSQTNIHPRWSNNNRGSYGRDTFGFSGLPGGSSSWTNEFHSLGTTGSWWTSNQTESNYGTVYSLDFTYNHLRRDGNLKFVGNSVRCIKD